MDSATRLREIANDLYKMHRDGDQALRMRGVHGVGEWSLQRLCGAKRAAVRLKDYSGGDTAPWRTRERLPGLRDADGPMADLGVRRFLEERG